MQLAVQDQVSEYRGSRWKAAIGVTICGGFVLLGWWLARDTSSFRSIVAGWVSIAVFGPMLVLWFGALITPMHLNFVEDGFTLKRPFLPRKHYKWDRIDDLWAEQLRLSSIVAWTYKVRPAGSGQMKRLFGQPNHYDAYLPFGWRVSADEIAEVLNNSRRAVTSSPNVC